MDQGVREITKLVDDFYGDGKTAYIFTADHGMSDWGSHGDGHPDNTRTPLVAWGSGVAKPVISHSGTALGHQDGFSADWGLDHVQRHDVNQADIAALMSYLAGIEFPVNSVGQLPLSFLTANAYEQAEAVLVNAREVLEMYSIKEQEKKATEIRYRPYAKLGAGLHSAEQRISEIRHAIDQGHFEEGITMSQDLLQIGLEGMRYLQTYDWLFLRMLVTLGYFGWIAYALTTVIDLHVLQNNGTYNRNTATSALCGIVLSGISILLWLRSAPYTYYLYALFPVIFWEEVLQRRSALISGVRLLLAQSSTSKQAGNLLLKGCAFVGLLEALVSFARAIIKALKLDVRSDKSVQVLSYFHRSVYTICFIAAAFWPLIYDRDFISRNTVLISTWTAACLSMSGFTLLPVIKIENISVM